MSLVQENDNRRKQSFFHIHKTGSFQDGGLWLVINGKVYDVQDWKDQAPCGADNLINLATVDATKPFLTVQHSQQVGFY